MIGKAIYRQQKRKSGWARLHSADRSAVCWSSWWMIRSLMSGWVLSSDARQKGFSSLAGLKVALGLKKKKRSKGWEDIYHAIHHQTFLKSQCQQVEANDAIIFPFNVHSAYLVQCRVQGRGFSWDFTAEIMQVHLAKIQVEAFFLPSSLEPIDFCFGCDRSRNGNTSASHFQNHRQNRKTRETREPIRRSGWQFNMKNEDKEQRWRLFPALLPANLEKEFS